MNHYPHHIGDYLKDTAHLSLLEHGCYRRMLDVYYTREAPMPPETAAVCRLVGASSREEKRAVEAVLGEFFERQADGWHQGRADAEIERYKENAEEQGEKNKHESERMRRHRERRKELFAALRERGIVPKWDIPMQELQRLADANNNAPETRTGNNLKREQQRASNANATANQNQNQNQEKTSSAPGSTTVATASTAAPPGSATPLNPENPGTAAGAMAAELRRKGVNVTSQSPTLLAWIADGFTIPAALEAVEIARQRKPEPEKIAANYLDPILRNPPKKANPPWWSSDQRTIAKGAELGLTARPGEEMPQFQERIRDALGKRKVAA